MCVLKDVESGECENRTSYNHSRTCSDALDNDIFAHGILAMRSASQTYGNNCNGDSGFKHLTHFKA